MLKRNGFAVGTWKNFTSFFSGSVTMEILRVVLVLLSCLLAVSAASPSLSSAEAEQVFGRTDELPEFEIAWSVLTSATRSRRSVSEVSARQQLLTLHPDDQLQQQLLHLSLDAFGHTYNFRLVESKRLVAESAALIHRYANHSDVDPLVERRHCLYTGVENTTTIAVNICTDMRGVIRSLTDEFIIEPLPPTARWRYKRRRRRGATDMSLESPLLVHRRRKSPPCSVLQETEKEYLLSRHAPLSSNTVFDRSPVHRGQDFTVGPLSNSADLDLFLVPNNRKKLPSTIFIETAVFVDKDLARHMQSYFPDNAEEQLIQIVLAMVNAVQLLYSDGSLGVDVHFVLKRLEIMHEDPPGLHRPHDIDMFLTNFCRWQRDENPSGDDHPLHWDHALVLTGLDLYTVTTRGRLNSQVVGLAPVAGMCSASSSCTVNEGRHFESVYVVAHEIGHNLGMRHDGATAGNNCDPGEHLMSPTLGSGKISWSTCSRRYLEIFLASEQAGCLRDAATAVPELDHRQPPLLPGQRFPADMQCMLKHGPGSIHADTQALEEICEDLHCRKDHYTWTSHPALEGTFCGPSRWCVRGRCAKQVSPDSGFHAFSPHKNPHRDYRPQSTSNFGSRRGDSSFAPIGSLDYPLNLKGAFLPPRALPNRVSPELNNALPTPFSTVPEIFRQQGPTSSSADIVFTTNRPTLEDWSECQSSCLYGLDGVLSSGSIGLQTTSMKCSTCRGQLRYRTCSGVQQCAVSGRRTVQDFAHRACLALRESQPSLSGLAAPFLLAGPGQCRVSCDQHGQIPHVSGTHYPDGTVCQLEGGRPAYCISGVCKAFTCDPESQYTATGLHCATSFDSTSTASAPSSSWGPWIQGSTCRTSCVSKSRGIELVSRQCLKLDGVCAGLSKNIRLCTPDVQDCHQRVTVFQHATDVCRRFQRDVSQLSGVGMQLANTPNDPDRACTVACQDLTLHYRFYRVNGREGWFPFGTDCSGGQPGVSRHCLNGKCLDFDQEGIPLQDTQGPEVASRSRSRSLHLHQTDEDLVEIKPLLPLHDLGSDRRRPATPPPFSYHQKELNLHRQLISEHLRDTRSLLLSSAAEGVRYRRSVQKRDVTVSSHRLPGSIDPFFLLSLVDQLNHTLHDTTSGNETIEPSTVDLANPIFVDVELSSKKFDPTNVSHHIWFTGHRNIANKTERVLEELDKNFRSRTGEITESPTEDVTLASKDDETFSLDNLFKNQGNTTVNVSSTPKQLRKYLNPLSNSGSRGRSMYQDEESNTVYEDLDTLGTDISQEIHGVWRIRKTPCSVTCGQGLMEVIVMCVPATRDGMEFANKFNPDGMINSLNVGDIAPPSSSLPKQDAIMQTHNSSETLMFSGFHNLEPHFERRQPKLVTAPTNTGRRTSFNFDGSVHESDFGYLQGAEQPDQSRSKLPRRNRIYYISIADPPIYNRHRTQGQFPSINFERNRASLFDNPQRQLEPLDRILSSGSYPSFTSNSQLSNLVHIPRPNKQPSYRVKRSPKRSRVRCSGSLPTQPGFQRCHMKACPAEEESSDKPSPVVTAWLSSLFAKAKEA